MAKATQAGFEVATNGNIAPIKEKIDQFISVFQSGIDKGDIYDIIYLPGKGVDVYKNNIYISTTTGLALKQAFLAYGCAKTFSQQSMVKEWHVRHWRRRIKLYLKSVISDTILQSSALNCITIL